MATVEQGINLHNTELQQSSSGTVSTLNFLPSVPSSWTQAHADSYTGAAAMWEAANAAAAHPVAAGDHQGQANCINLMGKMAYTSEHTLLMGAGLISTSIMEAPGSSAVHNWTAAKYNHEENQSADQIDKKDDDPAVLQYNHYAMLGCRAGRAADQDTAVVPSAAVADHHPDAAALLLTSSNPAAASTSSSSSSLLQQKRPRPDVPGSLNTTSHVAAAQPPDSPLHKKQRALSNKETLSKEDEGSLEVGPALNTNGRPRAKRGSATDPQSVYARQRRERINERLKILQNLVPNGAKVDIVTMLEEAISYVKFLQLQVKLLSSDEYWMYAPTTYNGIDVSFDMLQHSNQ